LSKLVPLVAGTVYLVGYIVTARRLADYGVSVTQLLNAQYFTAGMAPGLLIWLTVIVSYSAFTNDPNANTTRAQNIVAWIILILFTAMIAFPFLDRAVNWGWGFRISDRWRGLDSYLFSPLQAVLGLCSLWYVITGIKTRLFARMATYQRERTRDGADAYQAPIMFVIIAIVSLSVTFWQTLRIYDAIPQAYGGGKPMNVRLYVERDKAPSQLIAAEPTNGDKLLVYSVPLKLIFQTSDSLIVASTDGSRQVWIVDAHAVHAVNFNP
jgi:hypothetical protein